MTSPITHRDGTRQPSICLVTKDLDYVVKNSGVGTYFSMAANLLAANGWDTHILYLGECEDADALSQAPDQLKEKGITFHSLDDFPVPLHYRVDRILTQPNLHRGDLVRHALEILHAEHHFDLVEFPDWLGYGMRSIQAKRCNAAFHDVGFVVKLHGTSQWQREGNNAWLKSPTDLQVDFNEQYAFENADVQMSPSQYMLDYVANVGWKVRDDALVAYPYPQPEKLEKCSVDSRIEEIVFFGRIEPRKGLYLFLDAVSELPPDIRITFLGKDSDLPSGKTGSELIAEKLPDRAIEIHSDYNREQALAYLSGGNRLAVMPSLAESFGFVVAECAVNQIPFIATDTTGIPEVFSGEELHQWFLCKPNANALRQSILQHLDADSVHTRDMLERVSEAVDPTVNNRRFHEAYESALHKVRRNRESCAGRNLEVSARDAGSQNAAEFTDNVLAPNWRVIEGRLPRDPSHSGDERYVRASRVANSRGDAHCPRVTIGLAHYNHGKFLPEAVQALHEQTYENIEVIVIDDGSTDKSSIEVFDHLEKRYPRFQFIRQANAGPGATRNRCLEMASGEFFIVVDADNLPMKDMVERYVEGITHHPTASALTCYLLAFNETDDVKKGVFDYLYPPSGGPYLCSSFENVYGDTNAIFRTERLRAVGGFETNRDTPFEDWETFVKIAQAGYAIDVYPEPLFYYRLHGKNRSMEMTKEYSDMFPFIRLMIDRMQARNTQLSFSDLSTLFQALSSFNQSHYIMGALRYQLDHSNWVVGTLRDHTSDLEQHNQALQAHVDGLEQHAEGLKDHITKLHEYVQSQHERVNSTEKTLNDLQNKFAWLRYRVADKVLQRFAKIPLLVPAAKGVLRTVGKVTQKVRQMVKPSK